MAILRTQLRGLATRPTRILLTSLAVIVATAFAYGTFQINQILESVALNSFSKTTDATTAVVERKESGFDAATINRIASTPGVADIAQRVSATVNVGGVPSDQDGGTWSFTADPGTGPFARSKVTTGKFPTRTGEVAIGVNTADRTKLKVGDTFTIVDFDNHKATATVVGIVEAKGDDAYAIYAPADVLNSMIPTPVSRVDIIAEGGTSTQTVLSGLKKFLGSDTDVRDAANVRSEEAATALSGLNQVLVAISLFVLIAVIAAILVASSTFRIVFAQRMRQLALLRAVGAGRGRLVGALVAEGGITGLVAGVTGVILAQSLTWLIIAIVNATGTDIAYPAVSIVGAALCVVGAVLVTIGAVIAPAVSASRVSPLAALRTAAVADGAQRRSWVRIGLGTLFIIATALTGVGSIVAPDYAIALLLVVASGVFAFGVVLTFGPYMVPPVARLVGWPLTALSKTTGRLAVRNIIRSPRRVAATTSVVALGVTLITGLLVVAGSVRAQTEDSIAAQFPTDLIVGASSDQGLPADVVTKLAARPETSTVAPVRIADVEIERPGSSPVNVQLTGMDVSTVPSLADAKAAGGGPSDVHDGQIGLHSEIAAMIGVGVGDKVTVRSGQKTMTMTVVAAWQRSFSDALVRPADMATLAPSAPINSILVDAASGYTDEQARLATQTVLGTGSDAQILTAKYQREQYTTAIDRLLLIVLGLLGLTIMIALVGVATIMSLSIVERTTESGLLRALGLSRAGLRTTLILESGLFGLIGTVIGLVLGTVYAWLAIGALDAGVATTVPVLTLLGVAAALVVLTVLAGVLPSRRAATVSPVAALAIQ